MGVTYWAYFERPIDEGPIKLAGVVLASTSQVRFQVGNNNIVKVGAVVIQHSALEFGARTQSQRRDDKRPVKNFLY